MKKPNIQTVIIVIGFCLMLQFFVVGVVNVVRGYSIQSHIPTYIFLAGYLLQLPIMGIQIKDLRINRDAKDVGLYSSISIICSLLFICHLMPGFYQGEKIDEAKILYKDGRYSEAMEAATEEVDTWYLRLKINYHEISAWNMIAEVYCQQEQFDKAIETYNKIIEYYPNNFYASLSKEKIAMINEALDVVVYYPDRLVEYGKQRHDKEYELNDGGYKAVALYGIATYYKYHLNCYKKAKEAYQMILDLEVKDQWKEGARGYIDELVEEPE